MKQNVLFSLYLRKANNRIQESELNDLSPAVDRMRLTAGLILFCKGYFDL